MTWTPAAPRIRVSSSSDSRTSARSMRSGRPSMPRPYSGVERSRDTDTAAYALEHARELVRRGDTEAAWSVVAAAVPRWYSDDPLSIAPLTLLTDPALSPLVTP